MKRWASDSESGSDHMRAENPLLPSTDPRGSGGVAPNTTAAEATKMTPATGSLEESRTFATPSSAEEKHETGTSILLEFGDEYIGEVRMDKGAMVPHGRGRLQSLLGKHCYEGDFVDRTRDGYGKLLTERYVLWSKWKADQPDLANTVRVDYPNGDKYFGALSFRQDSAAAQQLGRALRARLSKFSVWIQTTVLVRERWGELTGANGDRYFGQWENDLPSGFGCLLTSGGDRYVGLFREGKFHKTGSLFSLSYGRQKASGFLLTGADFALHRALLSRTGHVGEAEKKEGGEDDNNSNRKKESDDSQQRESAATWTETASVSAARFKKERWGGVIFDGVWESGRFMGEGYVTLPCGSRLFAEWKGATHPTNGRLFFGSSCTRAQSNMNTRGWFHCFHWEPLLCRLSEELRAQEYAACASYRERLHIATTQEEIRAVLADFCKSQGAMQNALKLFCRCFYFFYGTCGQSSEIGSGLGSNRLGWCYFRNTHGGCIHHRRGRPIMVGDVDLAMTDIVSFVRSVERWVVAMLGDSAVADSSSELSLAREILDCVLLEVHDVLFNLYVHAFSEEDVLLSVALERLREHTTLDDMGVAFARQESAERLFDPYADAIRGIEQLGKKVHTFTGKLRVLTQWSREIDLAARLAQINLDDRSLSLLPRRRTHLASGSADDLFPIFQYVLIKARLRHLYAHTKLLVDLSSEDMFMEFASLESFFVTTLHACATILAKLHPLLRDQSQVLAPPSLFEDRLCAAIRSLKCLAVSFLDVFASHAGEPCAVGDAGDLHDVGVGYIRAWLPEALDVLSAQNCGRTGNVARVLPAGDLLQSARARQVLHLHGRQCPRGVALFCWLAAARVVSVLRLHLGVRERGGERGGADISGDVLWVGADPAALLRQYDCFHRAEGNNIDWRSADDGTVVLLLQEPLQPSFLHFAAERLLAAL